MSERPKEPSDLVKHCRAYHYGIAKQVEDLEARLAEAEKNAKWLEQRIIRLWNLVDAMVKNLTLSGIYRVIEQNPQDHNPVVAWLGKARAELTVPAVLNIGEVLDVVKKAKTALSTKPGAEEGEK